MTEVGATSCSKCDEGFHSNVDSSTCDFAASTYYMFDEDAIPCVKNAGCAGEYRAPFPGTININMNRRAYTHAHFFCFHHQPNTTCFFSLLTLFLTPQYILSQIKTIGLIVVHMIIWHIFISVQD